MGCAVPSAAATDNVLVVSEVALILRCSKAHVHNLINGKVRGASKLPSIQLGRRRLVLGRTLMEYLAQNELPSSEL
jgi:hypothetical protein